MARGKYAPQTTSDHWLTCTCPQTIKDNCMANSVTMAVWRRTAGVKSTCKRAGVSECLLCVHKDTQEREWVWRDGWAVCFRLGGNTNKKKKKTASQKILRWRIKSLPIHFLSISLSQTSTCRDHGKQLFVCIFRLKSGPAATNRLLLTVLFEQLQQGNVSTAFQAQALCGYVSVFYQAFRCINTQTGSTQHAL